MTILNVIIIINIYFPVRITLLFCVHVYGLNNGRWNYCYSKIKKGETVMFSLHLAPILLERLYGSYPA